MVNFADFKLKMVKGYMEHDLHSEHQSASEVRLEAQVRCSVVSVGAFRESKSINRLGLGLGIRVRVRVIPSPIRGFCDGSSGRNGGWGP